MTEIKRETTRSCLAITASGNPCRGFAVAGTKYCFFHSSAHRSARRRAQKRGGKNRHPISNAIAISGADITKPHGLSAFLARLIEETWKLEPSLNRARTLAYLVSVQKNVLQLSEIETRIAKLEAAATGADGRVQPIPHYGVPATHYIPPDEELLSEEEEGLMPEDEERLMQEVRD